MSKTAKQFRSLASKAFVVGKKLVTESSHEENVAFHKLHDHWLQSEKLVKGQEKLMRERYPFIKIGGRWHVSIPKLYLYLVAVRSLVSQHSDPDMVAVYDGIQAAAKYYEEAKRLDERLSPHKTSFENLEEYQSKLSVLYENYMTRQLALFGN